MNRIINQLSKRFKLNLQRIYCTCVKLKLVFMLNKNKGNNCTFTEMFYALLCLKSKVKLVTEQSSKLRVLKYSFLVLSTIGTLIAIFYVSIYHVSLIHWSALLQHMVRLCEHLFFHESYKRTVDLRKVHLLQPINY